MEEGKELNSQVVCAILPQGRVKRLILDYSNLGGEIVGAEKYCCTRRQQ